MKYTTATLALLAGVAAAQDNPFGDAVPDCAVDCLVAGIESIGCAVDDPACACTPEKQAAIASTDFIACLSGACTAEEVADAAAGGGAICDGISASGTAGAGASETSAAADPTSTASAGEAEPTGDDEGGEDGDDEESEGGSGGDDDADAGEDEGQGDGDEDAAAVPAVFGGAAVLAALLAL